jgi:hypothetical protein
MTGIEDAIYAAGSQAKLAKVLGCTQQNVGFWLRQGYCPAERVIEVEQATGVPRVRLINPKLVDLLTPLAI